MGRCRFSTFLCAEARESSYDVGGRHRREFWLRECRASHNPIGATCRAVALYSLSREMPEPAKFDPNSREFQLGQPQRGPTDPAALVRLLDEWMRDDEAEQR